VIIPKFPDNFRFSLSPPTLPGLVGLKSVVGKRDNLILNPLFDFDPMERFENWSDVQTLKSLDTTRAVELRMSWKTTELRLGKIQNWRVAVVEF